MPSHRLTQKPQRTPKDHPSTTTPATEELDALKTDAAVYTAVKEADTRLLNPSTVMHLQHTIGNQGVMRLLDASPRRRHDSTATTRRKPVDISQRSMADAQALQRLIGFEIETGIPAKKEKKKGKLIDPSYEDFNVELSDGSKLDVDADPAGGGKILEFASAPVSDTQSVDSFKNTARLWLTLLTNLRTVGRKSPPMRRLNTVVKKAPKYARIGVAEGSPGAMDRASIQATHGLRLDQVRTFFEKLVLQNPNQATRVTAKQQATNVSGAKIDPLMAELARRKDPSTVDGANEKQVEELAGFFTLVANYMLSGKAVASGYNKNRSFLFYKSKLNDVRNSLVGENRYARAIFMDDKLVDLTRIMLLIATQRRADEMLWVGTSKPNIVDWLNAILKGIDDPAFEAAKNPWGTDIKPGKVEGSLAAVVEHRDIDKVVPPDGALKMSEPEGIVEYLAKIFLANKEWESIKEQPKEQGQVEETD